MVRISTEEKAKYHAATSLASNHVTGLIYLAIALLKESGIEEQTAYGLLKPLAEQNIEAIFSQKDSAAGGGFSGCAQTLTGPIERGDIMTVKKHLDHLERPEWKAVYRAVGLQVTEAAVKKHPERSYEEMKQILAQ